MLREWIPSFLDEMSKVAELSKKEKRRQDLQFMALGAMSGPAIKATTSLIEKGRAIPEGVKPRRWALGAITGGALVSGAIPAVRRKIDQYNKDRVASGGK